MKLTSMIAALLSRLYIAPPSITATLSRKISRSKVMSHASLYMPPPHAASLKHNKHSRNSASLPGALYTPPPRLVAKLSSQSPTWNVGIEPPSVYAPPPSPLVEFSVKMQKSANVAAPAPQYRPPA